MANNSSSERQEKNKEKEVDPSQLFESIGSKLGLRSKEKPPKKSIFQVPKNLRKINEDSYSPRVVSIGPIHRGKSELLAMEELKWSYVETFFMRVEDPATALKNACGKILGLEHKARKYYAHDFKRLSKYQLAEILIIDGCFILEILLRKSNHLELKFKNVGVIKIEEDPILNNDLMIQMLQQDLALLENQIPFIVLETLIDCIDCNTPPLGIPHCALVFFSSVLNFEPEVRLNMRMEEKVGESIHLHLLQIMHNYFTESLNMDKRGSGEKKSGFEQRAIRLYEGGLKFEKASSGHLLNIKFDDERGVLQIPQLQVGGVASSLVRNLVAFEQCNFGTTHHMTAYVMFMRSLISKPEDVKLLETKGILKLELGSSEKDVLNYFENIRAEIVPKDYYFDSLCRQVNEYQKSNWNLQRRRASMEVWYNETMATMKRDYCPNPFKTMSVIAAFVLLLFTGLQTFYTVRSYYPR